MQSRIRFVHPVKTIRERVIEYLIARKRVLFDDMVSDLLVNKNSLRRVIRELDSEGLIRRYYDGSLDYDIEWVGDSALNRGDS